MKKKLETFILILMAVAMLNLPAFATSFPDVEQTKNYAKAVEYLSSIGIMVGDNQGNFNPNSGVTRAEMATLICRMLGEDENLREGQTFNDVAINHWANKYINKAVEIGVVNGYGNGYFGPNDSVSYAQAITMVVRAVGLESLAVDQGGYPDGYFAVAKDYGYNDGVFAESDDALLRWQVALIIFNAMALE